MYGFISNKDQAHTNKKQNIKKNQFFINHYAGPITYTINNWIYKNSDKIELDIENLIKNSKNYFLNENEHNKVQGISNDTNHQQENNMSNMHAVTQEKNNYINLKKDHMSDYVEKKMDTEEKICNMDNMMIGKTGEFVFLNEQENIWGDRCVPIIQGDEKKKEIRRNVDNKICNDTNSVYLDDKNVDLSHYDNRKKRVWKFPKLY